MKIYLIKENPNFLTQINSNENKEQLQELNKIYLLTISDFKFEENLNKKYPQNSEAMKIDLKNTFNPYK